MFIVWAVCFCFVILFKLFIELYCLGDVVDLHLNYCQQVDVMDIMKNKIYILLMIVIVLSSCTMQKRYHNSGFNLGLNHHFTRSAKVTATPKKSVKQAIQNPIIAAPKAGSVELANNIPNIAQINGSVCQIVVHGMSDFGAISPVTQVPVSSVDLGNHSMLRSAGNALIQTKTYNAKRELNGADLKTSKKRASSDGGGSGSRGFGIFLIVVGIIVFLFVSLIVGLLLALLGLVLMASGKSSNSQPRAAGEPATEEKKIEYVDVLYLQNGSIIRGMILELVPNVQVKIQTNDGSVFVYTMDQVLRITKQPK